MTYNVFGGTLNPILYSTSTYGALVVTFTQRHRLVKSPAQLCNFGNKCCRQHLSSE